VSFPFCSGWIYSFSPICSVLLMNCID
jgi:hypothetical protein